MVQKKNQHLFKEVRNTKLTHEHFVLDKWEAGIVLKGTEIKSIRSGKGQITEAFIRLDRLEPILYNAHIDEYSFGNVNNHNPVRPRKLLLHKREIAKIHTTIRSGGYSLMASRMYFKEGLLKIEVALCKAKKQHDKRQDLKQKVHKRETDRFLKERA